MMRYDSSHRLIDGDVICEHECLYGVYALFSNRAMNLFQFDSVIHILSFNDNRNFLNGRL